MRRPLAALLFSIALVSTLGALPAVAAKATTPVAPAPAAGEPHASQPGGPAHPGIHAPQDDHAPTDAPKIHVVVKGALERLKEGNRRYAEGKPASPRRNKDQRTLVAKAQLPFAIVVSCADSRVPPEIVFDQGLGDLFTVRVAGQVLDPPSIGSVEYAVEHLGTRLIVVLGHERCGAVDAACKGIDPGGHVTSLVQAIRPAVEVARRRKGDNLLADAVKANVQRVVDQLKGSWPVVGPEVRDGHLSVVGGIYDLETGLVEFLP
jgi:carbonic anhydrase